VVGGVAVDVEQYVACYVSDGDIGMGRGIVEELHNGFGGIVGSSGLFFC
jgi:hypothetical protein